MFRLNETTKKITRYIYWSSIIGLAFGAATPRLLRSVRAANQQVVPYTVTLQDYAIKPDGASSPTFKMIIGVRSDGSRVLEASSTVAGKPFAERILNLASGTTSYIIETKHQKSRTFDASKTDLSWLPNPRTCERPGIQVAGTEQVGQYRTVKIVDGSITEWLALDYGCALIKDRAEWPDGQMSAKRLVSLVPGEPSASLFDDPADFNEVQPSVLFPSPRAEEQDAYYYSHRPH